MKGPSASPATPNAAVRTAIANAFAVSALARPVARDFGLVAAGAKPSAFETFRIREGKPTRSFRDQTWDGSALLEALGASGLTVLKVPIPGDGAPEVLVIVSPDPWRAVRVGRLIEAVRAGHADAKSERRLGALLGYPRSCCDAFSGRRPRGMKRDLYARLPIEDRPFGGFVVPADETGLDEAAAYVSGLGRAFRDAYGDLEDDRDGDAALAV